MDDKTLILSEYLDQELPADVAKSLEQALEHDSDLRNRLAKLKAIKELCKTDSKALEKVLSARESYAKDRVWQRLQERKPIAVQRPSVWKRGILLPAPVLAVCALTLITAISIPLLTQANMGNSPAVANTNSLDGSAWPNTPTMGLNASTTIQPYTLPMIRDDRGAAITIQVEDLEQLITLLEQRNGTRDRSIQLPENESLVPMQEPVLIKAEEQVQQ